MAFILRAIGRSEQRLLSKPTAEPLSHRLEPTALLSWAVPDNVASWREEFGGAAMLAAGKVAKAAMLNRALVSIVDDDQPFRESMRKLVLLFGYTVEAFPSAADFLASRFLPETACLVADVHMPGMTGVELHKHLIDAGYAIPTILVTAYPDEFVRDRVLKQGVFCYLGKPVDDEHLERCLRSALQRGTPFEEIS
jgi:CheY-like chemotaxis protein